MLSLKGIGSTLEIPSILQLLTQSKTNKNLKMFILTVSKPFDGFGFLETSGSLPKFQGLLWQSYAESYIIRSENYSGKVEAYGPLLRIMFLKCKGMYEMTKATNHIELHFSKYVFNVWYLCSLINIFKKVYDKSENNSNLKLWWV